MIRLGLIGDNIQRSKSPLLHELAGRLCGLDVSYDRLIPADLGLDFDAAFKRAEGDGFRGINITYPYKESVFPRLVVEDERVRAIGACNTVLFENDGPKGNNTDYTGFMGAFRAAFGEENPGIVAMAGTGGVGRAVAFALTELGARELRLFDPDHVKLRALASALRSSAPRLRVVEADTIEAATSGSDGLINCTPLGMAGIPGTAVPKHLMAGCKWAFDAVYTPVDTVFLQDARASGLETISGYELFFHQGVDAFKLFTGREVDQTMLRAELLSETEG